MLEKRLVKRSINTCFQQRGRRAAPRKAPAGQTDVYAAQPGTHFVRFDASWPVALHLWPALGLAVLTPPGPSSRPCRRTSPTLSRTTASRPVSQP